MKLKCDNLLHRMIKQSLCLTKENRTRDLDYRFKELNMNCRYNKSMLSIKREKDELN
jgi:hypothetical protein